MTRIHWVGRQNKLMLFIMNRESETRFLGTVPETDVLVETPQEKRWVVSFLITYSGLCHFYCHTYLDTLEKDEVKKKNYMFIINR
jgi:hypothetical protein